MAHDPNNIGRDTFRKAKFGDIEIPVNSRAATSDRYVDRNRLRVHHGGEEYVPGEPGKNGLSKPGQWKPLPPRTASIMDNAREAAGALGARSSFANDEDFDGRRGGMNSDHLGGNNPLRKQRGDEQ